MQYAHDYLITVLLIICAFEYLFIPNAYMLSFFFGVMAFLYYMLYIAERTNDDY